MKIVEYSKGSITEVENVFKVVESGAQGPKGDKGDTGSSGASNSRDDHGPISVTEEFSAANTEHTASISADIGFTFADFSELQPRIRIKLTVVSGNPDVTPPAVADLSADSPQNLTNMATGVYIVKVVSFDDGTGYSYTVSHYEAGSTSSITEPIDISDTIPLTFSEDQNPATVFNIGNGSGTVELFNNDTPAFVTGTFLRINNAEWTFDPDSDLTVGEEYEFYLSKNITSLVGNRSYNGGNLSFTPESIYEDFTTYTEVDSTGVLTITSNKIDGVNIPRDADAYAYFDKGAAFFSGDFTHDFELYLTSADVNAFFIPWCVSNSIGNAKELDIGGAADLLYCTATPNSAVGDVTQIHIRETLSGARTTSATIALSLLTLYYCSVVRVDSTDQLTIYVYSDSSHTAPVDSAAITLVAKTDYRYLYGINNWNSGNAIDCTAYVQKLAIS